MTGQKGIAPNIKGVGLDFWKNCEDDKTLEPVAQRSCGCLTTELFKAGLDESLSNLV